MSLSKKQEQEQQTPYVHRATGVEVRMHRQSNCSPLTQTRTHPPTHPQGSSELPDHEVGREAGLFPIVGVQNNTTPLVLHFRTLLFHSLAGSAVACVFVATNKRAPHLVSKRTFLYNNGYEVSFLSKTDRNTTLSQTANAVPREFLYRVKRTMTASPPSEE